MKFRLRRRRLGQLMLVSTVAATFSSFVEKTVAQTSATKTTPMLKSSISETMQVTLQVNGTKHSLQIEPRVTLLDALREYIGLTGSKKVVTTVNVVLVQCWLMDSELTPA